MRMCLLFGIGLLIALGEARAETYPPVTAQMSVEQVGPHTFYAQGAAGAATDNEGFVSNAGFVVTDAGVVVFDALGSPSLAWTLRQKIRELTEQPVVKVIVSHYHADHIYGLQVFEDEARRQHQSLGIDHARRALARRNAVPAKPAASSRKTGGAGSADSGPASKAKLDWFR